MSCVERFDVDRLDDDRPFEVDEQASHLFKHPYLGLDDVADVGAAIPASIRLCCLPTG